MMKEYNQPALGNWHDLVAHSLLFLSMIAGLFVFGAVFVSDHDQQVYALYNRADDLFAQAYSGYQNQVYALSSQADNLSAGLSAQIYSVYSEHQKNYLAQQPRLIRPPFIYNRPLVRFNYSNDQFNKFWNQLENFSGLR